MTNIVKEVNEQLDFFDGASARIWQYDKTLSRLVIQIFRFDQSNNRILKEKFIVALGCEKIKASVYWKNICIRIEKIREWESLSTIYRIFDDATGFEVVFNGGVNVFDTLSTT